jgi:hypothetical protein
MYFTILTIGNIAITAMLIGVLAAWFIAVRWEETMRSINSDD